MINIIERAKKKMRKRTLKNQDLYDLLSVYPNFKRGIGGELRGGGSLNRPSRRVSAWPDVSGPRMAGCTAMSGETKYDRAAAEAGGQPIG